MGDEEQGRTVLHTYLRVPGQPHRGPLRTAAAVHPGEKGVRWGGRPLQTAAGPTRAVEADAHRLAGFLAGLSPESRRLSTFDGYDLATAQELCDAIARYDKPRLVLEEVPSGRIVGLLEFGLDLHPEDIARRREAGIHLAPADCRFGPTLADDYQGRGVGTQVFPLVTEVARRFGRKRIILWGGVLADNPRALRFYQKNGFHSAASVTGADGVRSLDMILDLASLQG